MHLNHCSYCGADPVIPCPICGSTDTTRITYGYPVAGQPFGVQLGGCVVNEDDPERYCGNCGFGFWPGHRTSPIFYLGPTFHRITQITPRTTPQQAAALRHMVELAIHCLDASLDIVADEPALDSALDPEVDDRWWWNCIPGLEVVCSPACRGLALEQLDTVPFGIWQHDADNKWVQVAGSGPIPGRTSLVHLSSPKDPVGVLILHETHQSTLITPPEGGPADPDLLTWQPPSQRRVV
jgi:hypothetical protein